MRFSSSLFNTTTGCTGMLCFKVPLNHIAFMFQDLLCTHMVVQPFSSVSLYHTGIGTQSTQKRNSHKKQQKKSTRTHFQQSARFFSKFVELCYSNRRILHRWALQFYVYRGQGQSFTFHDLNIRCRTFSTHWTFNLKFPEKN